MGANFGPFSLQDYVDMMEGLAGAAGLLSRKRKDSWSAVCPIDCLGGVADSEEFVAAMRSQKALSGAERLTGWEGGSELRDEIGVLNEWMWSGPLLPCHDRLQHPDGRVSPCDATNAEGNDAKTVDFSSRALCTNGRHEVMCEAIAETREVNAKLESAYRARTFP